MKKILAITALCCSIILTGANLYATDTDEPVPSRVLGTWHNELRSTLCITGIKGNAITGTYESTVGARGKFLVTGQLDVSSSSNPQAIGFTVLWNNVESGDLKSVTCWSGQYDSDKQEIDTFWLLTSAVGVDPTTEWTSTKIGQDIFRKRECTGEEFEKRLRKGNFYFPGNPASRTL